MRNVRAACSRRASSSVSSPGSSGGRVMSMFRCTPATCSGSARPSSREMIEPQSPPCAPYRSIPQPRHQLGPGPRDPARVPAPVSGRPGEPVAGNGRDDQVERVIRGTAMSRRVGQRPDDVPELHHRTRPAVRDDQRHRVRCGRTHVQEMHPRPVDRGDELVEPVQPRLVHPPVVFVAPVRRPAPARTPAGCRSPSRPRAAGRATGSGASRSRRSSRSACGTSIRNGRISAVTVLFCPNGPGSPPRPGTGRSRPGENRVPG